MNRALFITIGIVIIIFALMVWLFLFFNGKPASTGDIFADLGLTEPAERPVVLPDTETEGDTERTVLNFKEGLLQQVTTNPVAGFATASTTDGQSLLRYIERGTGYIFEVNLDSGLQRLATPNTIAGAVEAHFSPNLNKVVVVSEQGSRQVVLLELPNNADTEPVRTSLPADITNIQFLDNDTLSYTKNSYLETIGYTYDVGNKTNTERFRLPLPDATVVTSVTNRVFAYPRPAVTLLGAAYEIKSGSLEPVGQMAPGLTALVGDNFVIETKIAEQTLNSFRQPGNTFMNAIALPEKCTQTTPEQLWCGTPSTSPSRTFIEDWYKGLFNSDDTLVAMNTTTGEVSVLAVPKTITGRQLDVINPATDPAGQNVFFINKIDATLWLHNQE